VCRDAPFVVVVIVIVANKFIIVVVVVVIVYFVLVRARALGGFHGSIAAEGRQGQKRGSSWLRHARH